MTRRERADADDEQPSLDEHMTELQRLVDARDVDLLLAHGSPSAGVPVYPGDVERSLITVRFQQMLVDAFQRDVRADRAAWIAAALRSRAMTQQQIADAVGVSRQTVDTVRKQALGAS